jgi:hypothetical protein
MQWKRSFAPAGIGDANILLLLQPTLDQLADRIESTICKFALSFRRDFVFAIPANEPSRPDQVSRIAQPAKRVVAARMEKAVVAGDQVAV